jgi:hypothetical protein
MKVSGKAMRRAPFAPASSISRTAFSIEASRSRKAGAACTAATLNFGCVGAMVHSLADLKRQTSTCSLDDRSYICAGSSRYGAQLQRNAG